MSAQAAFRCLLVTLLFLPFGRDPFARAAGAPEEKFVGQWYWKTDKAGDHDQYWAITHDNGTWAVRGVYKQGDTETGSFEGDDVRVENGKLYYTHRYIKKINPRYKDTSPAMLSIEGNQLAYHWGDNYRFGRHGIVRLETAGAPGGISPKPDTRAKVDPPHPAAQGETHKPADGAEKELVGRWAIHTDRWDETWTVQYSGNAWTISAVYTRGGKEIGSAHGDKINYFSRSNSLHFTRIFDKKPAGDQGNNSACALQAKDGKLELHYIGGGNVPVKALVREGTASGGTAGEATNPPASGDKPKTGAAGAEAELAGNWEWKPAQSVDELWTVGHTGDEWKVKGLFFKDGRFVGSCHGENIQLVQGRLQFTRIWDKKPAGAEDGVAYKMSVRNGLMALGFTVNSRAKFEALKKAADAEVAALTDPAKLVASDTTAKPPTGKSGPTTRQITKVEVTKFTLPKDVPAVNPAASWDISAKPWHMVLSGDGKRLAIATLSDSNTQTADLLVFDVQGRKQLWAKKVPVLRARGDSLSCLAISGDGGLVAARDAAFPDTHFLLFNGATGTPIKTLDPLKLAPSQAVFHPSRPLLAITSYSNIAGGSVRLIDATSGRELWSLGKLGQPEGISFSPQGDKLAFIDRSVGANDVYRIKLIDAAKGSIIAELPADKRTLHTAIFSPDGKSIASFRSNMMKPALQIFDVEKGELTKELTDGLSGDHKDHDIVFLADGKSIAIGCFDNHIHILDIASGATTGVITKAFAIGTGGIGDMFLLPDGKSLILHRQTTDVRIYSLTDALPYPPPEK